jgi:hypothetical protein
MNRSAVAERVLPQITSSPQMVVPYYFICMTQEPLPPTSTISRLYSLTQLDTTQSVEHLRTSDQLDADTCT